jgi:hypothetical protein
MDINVFNYGCFAMGNLGRCAGIVFVNKNLLAKNFLLFAKRIFHDIFVKK